MEVKAVTFVFIVMTIAALLEIVQEAVLIAETTLPVEEIVEVALVIMTDLMIVQETLIEIALETLIEIALEILIEIVQETLIEAALEIPTEIVLEILREIPVLLPEPKQIKKERIQDHLLVRIHALLLEMIHDHLHADLLQEIQDLLLVLLINPNYRQTLRCSMISNVFVIKHYQLKHFVHNSLALFITQETSSISNKSTKNTWSKTREESLYTTILINTLGSIHKTMILTVRLNDIINLKS